jgi:hypothetical protein
VVSQVKIPAHHTLCAAGLPQVNVSARSTLPCIGKFGANVLDGGLMVGSMGGLMGWVFGRGSHNLGGNCLGEWAADQRQHRSLMTSALVGSSDRIEGRRVGGACHGWIINGCVY